MGRPSSGTSGDQVIPECERMEWERMVRGRRALPRPVGPPNPTGLWLVGRLFECGRSRKLMASIDIDTRNQIGGTPSHD